MNSAILHLYLVSFSLSTQQAFVTCQPRARHSRCCQYKDLLGVDDVCEDQLAESVCSGH